MQEKNKRCRLLGKEGVFSHTLFSCLFAILFLCLFPFVINTGHTAQVTLAWEPSASPDVLGYKVSYGNSSGSYATTVDSGLMTSSSLDGLEAGKTYYFAVQAYNTTRLESGFSNEVSYTTPLPAAKKRSTKH